MRQCPFFSLDIAQAGKFEVAQAIAKYGRQVRPRHKDFIHGSKSLGGHTSALSRRD
jgi:hypothetical protein